MEILIFSDAHIHPHKKSAERLGHCIEALDWAFKTALDRKIRNVVFLGDLFHDRQKIDVLTYQRTFEVFERNLLKNDLNVVLLLGNHDLWHYQKLDISSVNPLRSLPRVRVVNSPSVEMLSDGREDFFLGMLPYTHNPIEDLKIIDSDWNSKVSSDQKRVLGGHVSVDGAIWNVRYNTMSDVTIEHDGDMIRVGPSIFDTWDRVFLGHYHAAQKLSDKVEYVGSPLQLSFGEAFQEKHVVIYNTEDDSKEYVKNTFSPKHFILKEDEISSHELEGHFVRLEVDDMADRHLSDVRLKLMGESKVSTLEIKQSQRKDDHVIKDAKAILYKEEEMLEKYVEQANIEGLDKDILIKIGSEICHKEEN